MSLLEEFVPVSPTRPCPICGRRKFCLVDRASATDPARVVCTKSESSCRWGEAGWLHELRQDHRKSVTPKVRKWTSSLAPSSDLSVVVSQSTNPGMVTKLATQLGLGADSLQRLDVGWLSAESLARLGTGCRGAGAWTFPMRDAMGAVIGIRLRTGEGFKFAVKSSRQGLFVPAGNTYDDRLFIAEGPTDTAALLGIGLSAVGRPSCTGGAKHLVGLVRVRKVKQVVIVSDSDEPGLRGAEALSSPLAANVPDVRVIRPPHGVKDARAWIQAAPDAADQIAAAVEAAEPRRLAVALRKGGQ